MEFGDWLNQQTEKQDDVGALARRVKDDPCWSQGWPRLQTPLEIDEHLVFHAEPYAMILAFREAWKEWAAIEGEPCPW